MPKAARNARTRNLDNYKNWIKSEVVYSKTPGYGVFPGELLREWLVG
ncbi:hypothetical protein CORMATOL_01926 [Corynebacterium matruchotii ATCC 33806]|uniref:Uncharacterized protein n=1 Tax=Corynebacterium matruchotii ATCC 33806 TaxID=566549 RepID=C0E4K0_9CORY|nr:hypothetical protein CORMATOL_01926 [Corynebacterium matruchotii ATCC 33806]